MLVPLLTLLTTKSLINWLEISFGLSGNFLVGWVHSSVSAFFVWSICLLGLHESLHPMAFPRVRFWDPFFTSFAPLRPRLYLSVSIALLTTITDTMSEF